MNRKQQLLLQKEAIEKELAKISDIGNIKPAMILNRDYTKLENMVESVMKEIEEDDYNEDNDHYIYECVMETFYGPDVWKWINNNF